MTRLSKTLLSLSLLLLTSACVRNMPQPQLIAEPDSVTLRLAQAADRAANALDNLAAVEQVRTPVDLPPLASSAPAELRRSVTVDWIGPIGPIAQQLADRASYKLVTTGNPPETPVIVNVNVRNQPVIEVLRDVGLQLGSRATLKVDANNKAVELSYGNVQTPAL